MRPARNTVVVLVFACADAQGQTELRYLIVPPQLFTDGEESLTTFPGAEVPVIPGLRAIRSLYPGSHGLIR